MPTSATSHAQKVCERIQTILQTKLDDEIDLLNAASPWSGSDATLPYVPSGAVYLWDFPASVQNNGVSLMVTMGSEQFAHRQGSNEVDVVGEYAIVTMVRDAALGISGDVEIMAAAAYAYNWAAAMCVVRHLVEDARAASENIDRCSFVSTEIGPSTYDDKAAGSRFIRYVNSVVRVKRRTIEPFPS